MTPLDPFQRYVSGKIHIRYKGEENGAGWEGWQLINIQETRHHLAAGGSLLSGCKPPPSIMGLVDFVHERDGLTQVYQLLSYCISLTQCSSRMCEMIQEGKKRKGKKSSFWCDFATLGQGKIAALQVYFSIIHFIPDQNLSRFTWFFFFFIHLCAFLILIQKYIVQNPIAVWFIKTIFKIAWAISQEIFCVKVTPEQFMNWRSLH